MGLSMLPRKTSDKYSLENRVDYVQKLPKAEAMLTEYINWENSKEGKEKERLYIYRKIGKLVFTWGWLMEALQNEAEEDEEDIRTKVLDIIFKELKPYLKQNPKMYEKMLTTFVFILFVYPHREMKDEIVDNRERMLKKICKIFPGIMEDIYEYPGIILQMTFCEKLPYRLVLSCLKKWREDEKKEEEIGFFIRRGQFFREVFWGEEYQGKKFQEIITFMEEYIARNKVWQESYAFFFFDKYNSEGLGESLKGKMGSKSIYIKEQFEKLNDKDINILNLFFKYKNKDQNWNSFDIPTIIRFLKMHEGEIAIDAEEFESFAKREIIPSDGYISRVLEKCRIEGIDKRKLYYFQESICFRSDEEELVKFYRKKLFPKDILPEIILKLRKEKQTDKIPLLLHWMYGEEEND